MNVASPEFECRDRQRTNHVSSFKIAGADSEKPPHERAMSSNKHNPSLTNTFNAHIYFTIESWSEVRLLIWYRHDIRYLYNL